MLAPAKFPDHQVDDLRLQVQSSARRSTTQITVERDSELVLSAPPYVDEATLRIFAHEKRYWIYTKLAGKDPLQRQVPHKEFVGGEGFLYLGRSHRLKLVDQQDVPLKLAAGRFCLRRDAVTAAREHFIRWYSERAESWLASRLADYQSRMEVSQTGVKVWDLGYRWGSCGKSEWLYIHWKAILVPARIPEYVVVHEMAHLQSRTTPRRSGCAWSSQCRTTRSARPGWPSMGLMSKGSDNDGGLFHQRPFQAAEPVEGAEAGRVESRTEPCV